MQVKAIGAGRGVDRRIGGLEKQGVLPRLLVPVDRRIGGLEKPR